MKATAIGKVTRNDMLSCSQLPALLGVDNYGKTPNDVLRRCQDAIDGIDDDFEPNEAMGWGSRLELAIVEEAAERLGMDLRHGFTEAFTCLFAPLQCSLDAKITPILANQVIQTAPDRGIYVLNESGKIETRGEGCLEAKLTSMAPEDSPPLHRGPLQLQGQMMCTGAKWGALATLYRGTEMRIFVFDRHEPTCASIEAKARDFEARLLTYRNTGQAEWYPLASAEDGSRTWPEVKREEIELPIEAAHLIAALKRAKEMKEEADVLMGNATKDLMDMIGDAEVGVYGSTKVVWGSRSYKAQPEKVTPAKAAYTIRNKTLSIKEAA